MNITLQEIKLAYNKLKTYIYYDNTELFLRQKLVEFETDTIKHQQSIDREISNLYADFTDQFHNIFNQEPKTIEENLKLKFDKILNELNNFKEDSSFF